MPTTLCLFSFRWPLKTVIKAADDMQWINLKDNQFADGSLDALHTNMDVLDAKVSKAQIESNDSNQL